MGLANCVLGSLLLLIACQGPPVPQEAIARVGDAVLTETDLEGRLPVGVSTDQVAAERARLIDSWIQREMLYQEALRRELHQQARVQHLIEEARRDLLAAALLDAEFSGQAVPVDEGTIAAHYQERIADFQRIRPEIRVRHILLSSQRDANARYQALERGESFAALASEHSTDLDTRYQGGDLGYFSADQEPVLWDACQDLPLDRVSKPIRTQFGYHLFQVLDRQEAGTVRGLDQVRGQVVEDLVRQEHQERLDQFLARLKAEYDWSISPARADSSGS
jgi:peptidyl-prolyl cis-trans isomerase C